MTKPKKLEPLPFGALMSHEELAQEMGLSRQRIQQIEASAFAKLRRNPKARQLLDQLLEMGAGV